MEEGRRRGGGGEEEEEGRSGGRENILKTVLIDKISV